MSSVRILIVEDDADHGRSLQEAISDLGYEVEVAATGEAGIEAFRARGADVVLTDLVLPDVDGIAVMQRIRALGAACLFYTSPSPRDGLPSRMPASA